MSVTLFSTLRRPLVALARFGTAAAACATLACTFVFGSARPTSAAGSALVADLVHSRAEFTVSHMVLSKVWGHIPIRALAIEASPGSIVPTKIDVTLDPAHEDTDNHERDADLRSATYFDVAEYPTITFHSAKITMVPKSTTDFIVEGDLTIKNITKRVSFPAHVVGVIPSETGGSNVGYAGELHIDRRDFNMVDQRLTPAGVLLVGYDVAIGLTVEAASATPLPTRASS